MGGQRISVTCPLREPPILFSRTDSAIPGDPTLQDLQAWHWRLLVRAAVHCWVGDARRRAHLSTQLFSEGGAAMRQWGDSRLQRGEPSCQPGERSPASCLNEITELWSGVREVRVCLDVFMAPWRLCLREQGQPEAAPRCPDSR